MYKNKRVLVTGHTGFKGSWLALWLHTLGAEVIGYSLPPQKEPSLFTILKLKDKIVHIEGDVRDKKALESLIKHYQVEVIFHLAAQSLVFEGYKNPLETFDTNVMGTVNLLEALRLYANPCSVVIVTSDKCYAPKEGRQGYREEDPLGGKDPYSASKACVEIVVEAYRTSFFNQRISIATARSGNVIGGGDFSAHRLLPDVMQALFEKKEILLRNSQATRPWMHVLDPLYGYLQLALLLQTEEGKYRGSFNFGPVESQGICVEDIVKEAINYFGFGQYREQKNDQGFNEAKNLFLKKDKAYQILDWSAKYAWKKAVQETASWYKSYFEGKDMHAHCLEQIASYSR
jgi:CDP-glucose 4,6-dehydratase